MAIKPGMQASGREEKVEREEPFKLRGSCSRKSNKREIFQYLRRHERSEKMPVANRSRVLATGGLGRRRMPHEPFS